MKFHLIFAWILPTWFGNLKCLIIRPGQNFTSFRNIPPTVVEKPDRLCMGPYLQCIFLQIQAQYFCNRRSLHAHPPPPCSGLPPAFPHVSGRLVDCGMALPPLPLPVCFLPPWFSVDGTETLTSSIWNAGKTPVNAVSSTQWNNLWFIFSCRL